MSTFTHREQVSYFVLADNGLLYRNPVIMDEKWTLSYDYEEGGAILEVSSAFLSAACKDPVTIGRKILRGFVSVVADLDPKRQVRLDTRQHPAAWIFPLRVGAPLPVKYMRPQAGWRQPCGRPFLVEDFGVPWG